MTLSRRLLSLALGASLATLASPLRADPIVLNQWYTFGFGATGTQAISGAGFVLGIRSVAVGDPAWTINTTTPFWFVLTDGFQQGDSFSLFDGGGLVGSTPGVAQNAAHNCNNDEVGCFNDPAMSHNVFAQAAGAHSYTITVDASPYNGGAAFFCLADGSLTCDGVPPIAPEPSTYILLASGLLGVAGIARRRQA